MNIGNLSLESQDDTNFYRTIALGLASIASSQFAKKIVDYLIVVDPKGYGLSLFYIK